MSTVVVITAQGSEVYERVDNVIARDDLISIVGPEATILYPIAQVRRVDVIHDRPDDDAGQPVKLVQTSDRPKQ